MKYWLLAPLAAAAVMAVGWFAGLVPHSLSSVVWALVAVLVVALITPVDTKTRWLASLGVLVLGAGAQWLIHWPEAPFVIAAGLGLALATALWAAVFSRQHRTA